MPLFLLLVSAEGASHETLVLLVRMGKKGGKFNKRLLVWKYVCMKVRVHDRRVDNLFERQFLIAVLTHMTS